MTKQLLSEVAQEAYDFIDTRLSLELATASDSGQPLASYAPFYRDKTGSFYIYISTLATHTDNLQNSTVSIMIIEDEQDTHQIYARLRLVFQCNVKTISKDNDEFDLGLLGLKLKHGEIITTLSELADFKLVKLIPQFGRYIKGFGQAYGINPMLTEVTPISTIFQKYEINI